YLLQSDRLAQTHDVRTLGVGLYFADAEELVLQEAKDLSDEQFGESLAAEVGAHLEVEDSCRGEAPAPAVAFELPHHGPGAGDVVHQLVYHPELDGFERAPHAVVPPRTHRG